MISRKLHKGRNNKISSFVPSRNPHRVGTEVSKCLKTGFGARLTYHSGFFNYFENLSLKWHKSFRANLEIEKFDENKMLRVVLKHVPTTEFTGLKSSSRFLRLITHKIVRDVP